MKYVLIIGASHAGKSTTVNEICRRLNPDKVWRLVPNYSDLMSSSFEEVKIDTPIQNGTYLIQTGGIKMLVSAGSPTEQGITVTMLISICIKLKIEIKFLIVSMRSFEIKKGYDTKNELLQLGANIYEEKIYKIPGDDYRENIEWKARINRIIQAIQTNQ